MKKLLLSDEKNLKPRITKVYYLPGLKISFNSSSDLQNDDKTGVDQILVISAPVKIE